MIRPIASLVASVAAVVLCAGRRAPAAPPATTAPAPIEHVLPDQRAYEVLLPAEAGALAQAPVVLYLHGTDVPSFGEVKRDWWPVLWKRGCVLVMPRSLRGRLWHASDEPHLLAVLADVQSRYAVDPKRTILLGFSGGGQTALYLADRHPQQWRAVIVVGTNPVVRRDDADVWFYPDAKVLKTCPYFVVNHLTQGAALMYWRQVRAKLQPLGASISIVPVLGKAQHYQPPPEALPDWLDAVLAGRHPKPLPDAQKAAVAEMFAKYVTALPAEIAKAAPQAGPAETVAGESVNLRAPRPAGFEARPSPTTRPARGSPAVSCRMEHGKWPITIRIEAYAGAEPMAEVLAADERRTIERGLLYQVYHRGTLEAGGRAWQLRIGSITFPHRLRGWVSTLFIQAAAPARDDPKRWLQVLVLDETQQPDAKELARYLRTVLAGVKVGSPKQPVRARDLR